MDRTITVDIDDKRLEFIVSLVKYGDDQART